MRTDAMRAASGPRLAPLCTRTRARAKARKGTVLFRVIWENYPPDMIWYEPKNNVLENEGGAELLAEYEAAAAADAEAEAAEAAAEAELDALEEEEFMPAV